MSKHHVVYVPGLDDSRKGYELIIEKWKIYGVVPHVYRMGWKDGETSFKPKLKRFTSYIDQLPINKDLVSLVGASAGGSAVLNTYIERPQIHAVINLCGRLREGKNVHPSLDFASRKSPAFKESVKLFEKREPNMTATQRGKVLTITPLWDEVVPRSTVSLSGAVNKTIPSVEHMLSGLLCITIFSPLIFKFILKK
ncbi:MAG: hypothetical protein ACD_37C00671G0003 [uncultured bacterium]|nr:MAG: hypothetical protein ACD_37C00671G0003 [uncultured bacterium]